MKLLVDPTKKLFQWGPIQFRLFYGSIFCEMLWRGIREEYRWGWPPCVGLYDHGRIYFILNDRELRTVGEKYFKTFFLDRARYARQWKRYEDWIRRYDRMAEALDLPRRQAGPARAGIRRYTDREFVSLLRKFYQFNREFWMIVHVPEIANWGGEQMLLKRLEAIDRKRAHEYLEILSAPVKFSFFQEEELALLGIITPRGSPYLKGSRIFEQHARKWRWLLNSYGGNRVLHARFFQNKRKELLHSASAASLIRKIHATRQQNITRKRILARTLSLTKQDVFMAEQLAQSIWWQDHRKSYIWRLNYYWDILLHELARRKKWSFDDLLWCWPKEILAIAAGRIVDRAKIRSRGVAYVNELTEHGMRHIYGTRAKQYISQYLGKKITKTEQLHGLVVSKGHGKLVRGRVVVVRDPFTDGKKMRVGDILVAAMTSPEFIVVMKKASAIITDHGGMTSHAAIVSRELGIPCIVGTKVATSMLKSGDVVEVDAKKGEIKKLGN